MRKNTILAKKINRVSNGLLLAIVLFLILAAVTVPRTSLTDWDEGVYALQSRWFSTLGQQGKPYNFQAPPLFPMLAAAVSPLTGGHALALKWLSVFFSCFTVIALFIFVRRFFTDGIALSTVLIFMTTEYFLFFSRSGLSDATFTCFSVLAVLFFARAVQGGRLRDCVLTGACIILALYTKFSGIAVLAIMFALGLWYRKRLHRWWFATIIVLPALSFLPFSLVYLWVLGVSELHARHGPLAGVHHLKYLYYLIAFAPVPFLLTLLYVFRAERTAPGTVILAVTLLFFAIAGFYYPFFRLAYPLIPLFAILAARSLETTGKLKPYLLTTGMILGVALSLRSITYTTNVPEEVSARAREYARTHNVRYAYNAAPPNVLYYLGGDVLMAADHAWTAMARRIPFLMKGRTVMYPDSVLLEPPQVLFIHAAAADSFEQVHASLFAGARTVARYEFIDAPVYYKDLFNEQRNVRQDYRICALTTEHDGERVHAIWALGFLRGVDVVRMYPNGSTDVP